MAGNTNYDGANAYAVAKLISQRWNHIWMPAQPFYAFIKGKMVEQARSVISQTVAAGRMVNNGFRSTDGTKMILPVSYLGPATSARAATDANAFTPITPYAKRGDTMAEYYYATYENAAYFTIQDTDQLVAGKTQFLSPIPVTVEKLLMDMIKIINADMVGTQQGTGRGGNGQLNGEQYWLSTSNSPGNISQTTYSTWAAGVTDAQNAPLAEAMIMDACDRIRDLGRGGADFLQLSYSSSNNLYGKLRSLIGSAQITTNPNAPQKYGFQTFQYADLECWPDGRLGDSLPGSMVVGRSGALWLNQDSEEPRLAPKNGNMRLPGTSSEEHFYSYTLSVGINDPASQTLVENVK